MKHDKNTFKGFLFFLLRLISVALVASALYLAYDLYTDYKSEKYIESVSDDVTTLVDSFLELYQESLK